MQSKLAASPQNVVGLGGPFGTFHVADFALGQPRAERLPHIRRRPRIADDFSGKCAVTAGHPFELQWIKARIPSLHISDEIVE